MISVHLLLFIYYIPTLVCLSIWSYKWRKNESKDISYRKHHKDAHRLGESAIYAVWLFMGIFTIFIVGVKDIFNGKIPY